jgi:predicted 3-demethylubiquinone-9 3-methyltransferase (glyoxalase superfamily)
LLSAPWKYFCNSGPIFKFNEAVSFIVNCNTHQEIDNYWEKLSEGGDKNARQCGWLKDKFGLSWQIVPTFISEVLKRAYARAFSSPMLMDMFCFSGDPSDSK